MIAPSASCNNAGAKSMTAEPTGSLSALSGDGFAITAIPPIIIKIPAIIIIIPNPFDGSFNEMKNASNLPITAKTRIGYDNLEDYEYLKKFLAIIDEAGAKTFIIHARRAILHKLSPKQNLNIPPLNYKFVYDLKNDFSDNIIVTLLYGFLIPLALPLALALNLFSTIDFPT